MLIGVALVLGVAGVVYRRRKVQLDKAAAAEAGARVTAVVVPGIPDTQLGPSVAPPAPMANRATLWPPPIPLRMLEPTGNEPAQRGTVVGLDPARSALIDPYALPANPTLLDGNAAEGAE